MFSGIKDFRQRFSNEDREEVEKTISIESFSQLSTFTLHLLDPSEDAAPNFLSGLALRDFFKSCSEVLTTLHLKNVVLSEDTFLMAVAMLPHLQSLVILDIYPDPYFTLQVARRLSGHGHGVSKGILAELKHIEVDLLFNPELQFSHFAELVISRCNPVKAFCATPCCALQAVSFPLRGALIPDSELDQWKVFTADHLSVTLIDSSGIVNISDD